MFIRASSRIASPDESGYESIVWRVSPTTPPFTDKQGQYLAFIYAYSRIFRQPPAEADMQRHFQVSPPSVHQMVLTLERAGLIRRTPRLAYRGPRGEISGHARRPGPLGFALATAFRAPKHLGLCRSRRDRVDADVRRRKF